MVASFKSRHLAFVALDTFGKLVARDSHPTSQRHGV